MEYKRLMQFNNDTQRHAFNIAFEGYVRKIHRTENPQNKTIEELEQAHYLRFQSCNWDWVNHCFIPDEPEPLAPNGIFRYSKRPNGTLFKEVFNESTQIWSEEKPRSR